MKHYYLNDLSSPNLWNISGFDYVFTIIKNTFLFIKQIFLQLVLFFVLLFLPASLWLKDHNENKAICLFCVILVILFFFSLILSLISTFFVCCNIFIYIVWLFNFVCTYLDLLFLWENKKHLVNTLPLQTKQVWNSRLRKQKKKLEILQLGAKSETRMLLCSRSVNGHKFQ